MIDLELVNIGDLTADDNGVYIDISCPFKSHKVKFEAGKVSSVVEWHGGTTGPPSGDMFYLKRQYGTHKGKKEKADVQFKRIISTVKDSHGRYLRYAIIQYFFKDSPEIPLSQHLMVIQKMTPECSFPLQEARYSASESVALR